MLSLASPTQIAQLADLLRTLWFCSPIVGLPLTLWSPSHDIPLCPLSPMYTYRMRADITLLPPWFQLSSWWAHLVSVVILATCFKVSIAYFIMFGVPRLGSSLYIYWIIFDKEFAAKLQTSLTYNPPLYISPYTYVRGDALRNVITPSHLPP